MRQAYFDLIQKISSYKVAKQHQKTIIPVGDHLIGAGAFTLIAGPCSVESLAQIQEAASGVKQAGAHILRGGAFKPRTSPYQFQGLGEAGLHLLKQASECEKIPIMTEIIDKDDIDKIQACADILQVGSRNMHNFSLLKALGKCTKPVLLKRGLCATIEEFLMAAEYILNAGNAQVILCEREIRTYESTTRNTLDLNTVAILKQITHLPVIVDPSHGTGITDIMLPMTKAAMAAGADGIMLEVHPEPERALSDKEHALTIAEFEHIVKEIEPLAAALKRGMYDIVSTN